MRGSAALRAVVAPGGVLAGPWVRNELWRRARAVPSLDLRFAESKSLVDSVSGQLLITFTRATTKMVTNSQGALESVGIDVPAFDHNPLTGEGLGLLVEEQRQNLLLRSEEFGDAAWAAVTSNVSVTSNTDPAPNGTQTADTLDFTNASSFRYQQLSTSAGTTYTFSVWLASKTKTQTVIRIAGSATGTGGQLVVDLTPTLTRYSLTVTIPAGNTASNFGFENRTGIGGGNGSTGTIIAWGAQVEAASFPTSYIPTTGTAATRTADVVSITGTNFSSWYRQDAGSVFVSSALLANVNTYEASFTDNTNNNHHFLRYVATQHQVVSSAGGVANVNIFADGGGSVLAARTAYTYGSNAYAVSTNGTLGAFSSTTGGIPSTVDRLNIGFSQVSGATGNLTIRRLTYWPTRLPNSTLQSITQ